MYIVARMMEASLQLTATYNSDTHTRTYMFQKKGGRSVPYLHLASSFLLTTLECKPNSSGVIKNNRTKRGPGRIVVEDNDIIHTKDPLASCLNRKDTHDRPEESPLRVSLRRAQRQRSMSIRQLTDALAVCPWSLRALWCYANLVGKLEQSSSKGGGGGGNVNVFRPASRLQ